MTIREQISDLEKAEIRGYYLGREHVTLFLKEILETQTRELYIELETLHPTGYQMWVDQELDATLEKILEKLKEKENAS